MKKLLLTCLLALGVNSTNVSAAESTLPLVLKPTYLNYVYSFQDKRCEKMTIGNKKYYLDKQADGSLLVERNFVTDAGVVSETLSEIKGVEYQHVFAETYGGCMLYVDAIILNKEIKDKKAYANLKDPKFK